jgi:glutathione S-transferase
MITVHHLDNSRSQRVLWLLEELSLEYVVVPYARDPATRRAPEALRAIHPLGKAPVVEADGLVLAESGAIIEYLLDRHDAGRLRPPPGSDAGRAFTHWLHYAEGSAMPQLLLRVVFDGIESGPLPLLIRPLARALARGVKRVVVAPQLTLHLDHMEASVAATGWFAGDGFSAADIQMSFPVQAAASLGLLEGRPALADWQARIEARPAWQRGVARGGAYSL